MEKAPFPCATNVILFTTPPLATLRLSIYRPLLYTMHLPLLLLIPSRSINVLLLWWQNGTVLPLSGKMVSPSAIPLSFVISSGSTSAFATGKMIALLVESPLLTTGSSLLNPISPPLLKTLPSQKLAPVESPKTVANTSCCGSPARTASREYVP